MSTETQLAAPVNPLPTVRKKGTILDVLSVDAAKNELAKVATKHATPDRMLRLATTYVKKTPALLNCTVESFMGAFMSLSQLGLVLDGRQAHLIPYKDQCTLIIDYKGIIQLMYRSGFVKSIHADVICDNDFFQYRDGVAEHSYDLRKDRGEPYGAFCTVHLTTGGVVSEVMSARDIDAIRQRSKAKDSGPWVTDTFEMWKKTVLRRVSKWIPWSAEMEAAFESDADVIDVESRSSKLVPQLPVPTEEAV